VAAVYFVMKVTNSHLGDIGGPIDIVLMLGIAALGAAGMAILVYTVQSIVRKPVAQ